jgi:hypothetical protein
MAAVRYFDLIREMRNAYNHRLRLVASGSVASNPRCRKACGKTVRSPSVSVVISSSCRERCQQPRAIITSVNASSSGRSIGR